MNEAPIAHVISDAAKRKHYVIFVDALFEYVSNHPLLSPNEKLIWFNIARKCIRNPNLSCRLTYQQIAEMVCIKQDTAYRAIRNLKGRGFLNTAFEENDQIVTYFISLPDDGVIAIQKAPDRALRDPKQQNTSPGVITNSQNINKEANKKSVFCGEKSNTSSEENPITTGRKSDTPPDQNPILLLNNNINNKKHNNHNKHISNKPKNVCDYENAEALFFEFEKKQKQFKHLTPAERIRVVNSHFTHDQIKIIAAHMAEKQRIFECREQKDLAVQRPSPQKFPSPPQATAKLIAFDFEGEQFLIEEGVKDQIMQNIPSLYHSKKITGSAAERALRCLLKEILFYVTKAQSMEQAPMSQLKKYYIARKLCIGGVWEKPRGLIRGEEIKREKQWEISKMKEAEDAKRFFSYTGESR